MPAPLILMLVALLVPIGTFLLLSAAGRRMGALCGIVATLSAVAGFVAALVSLMSWLAGGVLAGEPWGAGEGTLRLIRTWAGGPAGISFGLHIDSLTILVLTAGLLASCCIHVFATGYLRNDVRGPRVFALMALSQAALVGLMTSASLPQWTLWSMVASVAAYLVATPVPLGPGGLGVTPIPRGLVPADLARRATAALTVLLLRLAGDAALLVACGLLARPAPGLTWGSLWAAGIETVPPQAVGLLTFAAICHACAFPLALFVPDAKGAPTPAAALAYAVTLLPAGPLLLARVFPVLGASHLFVLGVVGVVTMIVSAVAALAEADLRRWLAWIAMTGVGATLAAIGAGSIGGAVLHVVTGMVGLPILMLAAGSILHNCLGERRFSHYGGLLFRMPASALLLAHGAGTLLGGPLLAGSASWNVMLSHAYRSLQAGETRGVLVLAGLFAGLFLMTAAAARGWMLLLLGRPRDRTVYAAARESATLSVPVALLALVSTVSGHPTLSPVRQLVLLTPIEMAVTVAPEHPETWTGMALSRDVAPPVVPAPPAPEDVEAIEAMQSAPLPPDDKIPKLIQPAAWVLALVGVGLGAALTRLHGRTVLGVRPWLARAGHLGARLSSTITLFVRGIGLAGRTLEAFVLSPLLNLLTKWLMPVPFSTPGVSPASATLSEKAALAWLLLLAAGVMCVGAALAWPVLSAARGEP